MASARTTSRRSSQPPKYPPSKPTSTPRKIENAIAHTMASSAVCAPQIVRDRTSNPLTVVPRRLTAFGAWRVPKS